VKRETQAHTVVFDDTGDGETTSSAMATLNAAADNYERQPTIMKKK
jgi:hypothetical protein